MQSLSPSRLRSTSKSSADELDPDCTDRDPVDPFSKNPGDVGAGDGVCDFVDPGESIRDFLFAGTSSDKSRTSLSRLRLLLSDSFLVELVLELLLRGAEVFNGDVACLKQSSTMALSWLAESFDLECSNLRARTNTGSSSIPVLTAVMLRSLNQVL